MAVGSRLVRVDVFLFGQGGEQRTVRSRQVELPIDGTCQRKLFFRTAYDVVTAGVKHRQAHFRSLLPTVVHTLQVMVEEAAQVFHVFGRIVVEPLLRVVHAQPLFLRCHAAVSGKGAMRVHRIGVAGHHVGRYFDVLHARRLVLPVVAHQRFLDNHARLVFQHAVSRREGFGNHLRKLRRRDAAPCARLAVVVAEAFPGSDGNQVFRPLGSDEPLRNGQPRVARHADLARTPVARSNPLDDVATVQRVLVSPVQQVALGHIGATLVHIHDGIPVVYPIGGIGSFKLLQARSGLYRHTGPHRHVVQHLPANLLAVRAPHQDGRTGFAIGRTEHIGIDGDTVAQFDGNISFQQNVAGQRFGSLATHTAGLQHQCLLPETRIAHTVCTDRQSLAHGYLYLLATGIVQGDLLLCRRTLRADGQECQNSCINPLFLHILYVLSIGHPFVFRVQISAFLLGKCC